MCETSLLKFLATFQRRELKEPALVLCKIKFCSAMDQKYGEDEDSQPESISMVGENGTKHLDESFF
jgi:hypothetical protein